MTSYELMDRIGFGCDSGSVPVSGAIVASAGTTAINGTYTKTSTYLWEITGYKIVGTDSSGDTLWEFQNSAGTETYYSGGTLGGTLPWDMGNLAVEADGTAPVPTITES